MGTWGTGPFDSDMAEDFVDQLEYLSEIQRAAILESRFERAMSGGSDELLSEVLAAAAVVAANLSAGKCLPWNEDYPGISEWLGGREVRRLVPLAANALEMHFQSDGWYWRSWVDEEERSEAHAACESIRQVLRAS
ncbi:DUF4259 domain-containing protein [Salinispora arenicola]|uniref:DUF4259 domain-containing protein n=1 Tax=Salinispora arenicola TaxID=168697 RepID=UPI0009B75464|nr:DUF4259 domain-containing protein [Salinispora arenicola]